MEFLKNFLVAGIAFFGADMLWLGVVAKGFYQKHLGNFLRETPLWSSALVFYGIYLAGLVYFAILPNKGKPGAAALAGAFFGVVAYSTYELTNHALVKNWPWAVVIPDILWGGLASAFAAAVAVYLLR